MSDEAPDSRELVVALRRYDAEAWKHTRLRRWCWTMWSSGFVLFAGLVAGLHRVMKPVFCKPHFGVVCQEYYSHDPWLSWTTTMVFALAGICLLALAAMGVIWFSRFGHRLHIRGPMTNATNRQTFVWWLTAVSTGIASFGTMSTFFLTLGR